MAAVRPWGGISHSSLDFASADSAMGHVADFALGIALAQPSRRVICLNGDGSMLMSLGTLATIVEARVSNLIVFIMENGTYEITGNQPVPGSRRIDYPILAQAVGFPHAFRCESDREIERTVSNALSVAGPVLVSFVVEPGNEGPISRSPNEEAPYLRHSLAESARHLRKALASVVRPERGSRTRGRRRAES